MPRGRKSAKEALRRRGLTPLVRGKEGFTETYSLFASFVLFADNVYIPRRMMRIRRIYLPYPLFAPFVLFADNVYISRRMMRIRRIYLPYSLFASFVLFADNVYIPRRMMRIRRIYLPYPLFVLFAPFADTKYLSGKGVLLMAVTYDCRLSSSKVNDLQNSQ